MQYSTWPCGVDGVNFDRAKLHILSIDIQHEANIRNNVANRK